METLDAIFSRKSIREYTPQTIPGELVHQLLAAAMQAPSAGNQQPWHFVLVTDRPTLMAMADVLPYGKMLNKAPLGIVVCADLELEKYPGRWVLDCSTATMNLLLATHDCGLGAVWVAVYPVEELIAAVKHILGMPASVIPLNVIPVGFPASKPESAERRYNETRIHDNHW